jgi:hypothetical protein
MYDLNNPWHMAGTEGTGKYTVVAQSALGRIGFRTLGNDVRVRVEPVSSEASKALAEQFPTSSWKQPEPFGQKRFSIVVAADQAIAVVERAIKALGRDSLERNAKARYWRKLVRELTS